MVARASDGHHHRMSLTVIEGGGEDAATRDDLSGIVDACVSGVASTMHETIAAGDLDGLALLAGDLEVAAAALKSAVAGRSHEHLTVQQLAVDTACAAAYRHIGHDGYRPT